MDLDRNRLYALIAALENDLRDLIRVHLSEIAAPAAIIGVDYYPDVRRRYERGADAAGGANDIFDFLSLREELSIVFRYSAQLPAGMRQTLRESRSRLDALVPIRNRVMHAQPLRPEDYRQVRDWLGDLEQGGFTGESLRVVLRQLRANPTWSPTAPVDAPLVANNLPLGDYDETGLLGRETQVEAVCRQLKSRRHPAITLIGPGGIGKTALAVEVLHRIAADPDSPYEVIAWVSLKTERLTAAGTLELRDAVRSLDEALPVLAAPLGGESGTGVADLARLLDGVQALIAIDNLETITGQEVVDLIEALPATVNYLFTSRVGIGDSEHKVRVEPLDLDAAILLFDSLARARQVDHLVGLPRAQLERIQEIASRSPLHIRWFVECAAAGQPTETIISHRDDLIQFCVQNVYRGLTSDAKDVANVLAAGNAKPQSASDLRYTLTSIPPDTLRAAIQELLVRRLAVVARVEDQVDYLQATESLISYLNLVGADADDRHKFAEMQDARLRAEERLRLEQARTPLRVNVIGGAEAHPGAALALRDALVLCKKGQFAEALDIIEQFAQLEPEYWELHRVRGNVLAFANRAAAATAEFERAIDLAPDEAEAARMRYFFAEHLILNARDARLAAAQAGIAHRALQRPESAMQLGRALAYDHQFAGAVEALREAYATPDVKMALMACTLLVDTYRRWSEEQSSVLNSPEAALETLAGAVDVGLGHTERDQRLCKELYRCVADALRIASRLTPTGRRDECLRSILRVADAAPLIDAGDARTHVIASAKRLLTSASLADDLAKILEKLVGDEGSESQAAVAAAEGVVVSAELTGRVKVWRADRGFGFITATTGHEYFFHFQDLDRRSDQIFLASDLAVSFTPTVRDGKSRASAVRLAQEPKTGQLRRRGLTVLRMQEESCTAVDDRSGVRIYVGSRSLAPDVSWEKLAENVRLVADLVPDARSGYVAADGSVTLR